MKKVIITRTAQKIPNSCANHYIGSYTCYQEFQPYNTCQYCLLSLCIYIWGIREYTMYQTKMQLHILMKKKKVIRA